MPTDDILTVAEAAAYAKLAPKTLRTWLKQGRLPGLRVGRHWRVERRVLLQFLRQQGRQAVQPHGDGTAQTSGTSRISDAHA